MIPISGSSLRRIAGLIGVGLFLASILFARSDCAIQTRSNSVNLPIEPLIANWFIPAPPINIANDDDWISCPWDNGTGTIDNPYILCNLSIDAGAGYYCINISNTVSYFKIVNCTLTGSGTSTPNYGIILGGAGNGTLLNNTCYNCYHGICLSSANTTALIDNNCIGNRNGIILTNTKNNTLIGNNCSQNSHEGISLDSYCCNNTLSSNNCTRNTQHGIYLTANCDNNTVSGNNCSGNEWHGISFYDNCNNNTLSSNNCTGNTQHGIYLTADCVNNTVSGNNCTGNVQYGLYIRNRSNNNTLSDNDCSWSTQYSGIYLQTNCKNNTLTNNNCTGNAQHGIYLNSGSNNNTLTNNNCSHNGISGIQISASESSSIHKNTCSKNVNGIGLVDMSRFNDVYQNWLKKSTSSPLANDTNTNNIHDNSIINYSVASFTANVTSVVEDQSVNFTDTTTKGGLDLDYEWSFGEGTNISSIQDNYIHSYATPGTYYPTLTIQDSDGDVSVTNQTIIVTEDLPVNAEITLAASSVTLGTDVDLTATLSGNSPTTYSWDFGDGSFGSGQHVTHSYTAAGIYIITLMVTDADGDFHSTTVQVTITTSSNEGGDTTGGGGIAGPSEMFILSFIGLAMIGVIKRKYWTK